MQTGSSETLIGWISGKTTYVPLWDRMKEAWLWTLSYVLLLLYSGGLLNFGSGVQSSYL
jgi:hypothetical protein